jgi:hypothetical protein
MKRRKFIASIFAGFAGIAIYQRKKNATNVPENIGGCVTILAAIKHGLNSDKLYGRDGLTVNGLFDQVLVDRYFISKSNFDSFLRNECG